MSALADLRRPALAFSVALVLVAVAVVGIVGVVIPTKEAPAVSTEGRRRPPLTQKLLLVIIDGLRYDVGSDPTRMPLYSKELREQAGGELMAGRVSMTTSAVLGMGTGQRGSFEQVVRNVSPDPTPFDSWLVQAQRSGLKLMIAGDAAWNEMYPSAFAEFRPDPKGVAIDVDFNPKTFRDARELRALDPDVLIAHFVTPDHQGHSYSIPSKRYADHIRGFERDLFQFLDEMPPGWTIVVMGDHGAADSGTHGADVPIQRRTVIFARGPGIVRGARVKEPIDQIDLAGTFAALLGLPVPAHSRGHLLVEWLDISPTARAELACANAQRADRLRAALGVGALGETSLRCDPSQPNAALPAARAHVESVDRAIEADSGLGSAVVPYLIVASVALGVLAVLIALGLGALKGILAAIAMGAIGVLLTWGVERLPAGLPMTARLVLFVLGNVPALLVLTVPAKMGLLAERARFLAPAIVPGFLIATYTTNAHPESWVTLVVSGILLVLVGGLAPERPTLRHAARMLHPAHGALFALGLAALFFAGTRTSDLYPAWLRSNEPLMMAVAIALLALTSVSLFARANPQRWLMWAALTAIGLGAALVLRRHIPPLPGRALIVVSIVVSAYLAVKDRRLYALIGGLFTYCWISRDQEILTLAPTLLVADAAGAAFARHRIARGAQGSPLRLPDLLLCTAFLFGLAFVQRVGIQGAIDFGSMDWGAASFGDVHVSPWTVGAGIATKYALGLVLALGAFASELGPKVAERVLCAAFVAFVARSVLLAVMFLVAGGSFWTGLRVLGDLPMALIWTVATGLAWIGSRYVSLVSSSS